MIDKIFLAQGTLTGNFSKTFQPRDSNNLFD